MLDKTQIDSLIKSTHQIQADSQSLRETIDKLESCGMDNSQMVKIIMNAKRVVKKVSIDPLAMKNKELLEKLIIDAFNNGTHKVEKCMESSMISLSSSIRNAFTEIKLPI